MPHRSKYGFRPSATTLVPNFDPDILKATHKPTSPPTQATSFLSLPPEIRNKIYAATTRPTSFRPGVRKIPNLSLAQTSKQMRAEYALTARSVVQHFWSHRHLSPPFDSGRRGLEIYLAPTCTGRTVFSMLAEDVAERFDYFLIYVGCRSDLAPRSPDWAIRPRAVYVWRPRGRLEGCGTREMVHGDGEGGWIASLERSFRGEVEAAEGPTDSDQEEIQATEDPGDSSQERMQVAEGLRELGFQGEGDEEKERWIRREVLKRILRELDTLYELERGVKSVWRTVLAAKRGVVSREIYKGFY